MRRIHASYRIEHSVECGPSSGIMALRVRTFAWFIALTAIMLRAVLPAGWMPVAGLDGGITLAICTGHGPLALSGHAPKQPSLPGHANDICPFAAVGHLSPPTPFAILSAPFLNGWKSGPADHGRTVSVAWFDGHHNPRAPPFVA